jgi:S1-C subfamily serine protease
LQTSFVQEPYDEARRLGLPDDIEKELRSAFPEVLGVLVTRGVLIGGPGEMKLRTGDLVVGVDGRPLEGHVALEAALDSHVGTPLKLRIVRGGEVMEVEVTPGDLHAVTPSEYIEVGGAVLHPLSLQQARNYGIATRGIYVATPGYSFGQAGLGRGAVLTEIDGVPVRTMDELQAQLLKHPDGDRFSIRYFNLPDPRDFRVAFATMDRRWFDASRCRSQEWVWSCVDLPPSSGGAAPDQPQAVSYATLGSPLLQKLAPSLVYLRFTAPFRPDGLYTGTLRGTGVVVDTKRGWILTDRDTVPIALGDVRITVAGAVQIPGRVLWVHPVHNLALVAYDPALLVDSPLREVTVDLRPLKVGEELWEVGYSGDQELVSRQARVSRMSNIDIPLPNPPFFRDSNLEVAVMEGEQAVNGGMLVDRQGRMRALWASFVDLSGEKPSAMMRGIPARNVAEALEAVREGASWPVLGVELQAISLAEARQRGLSPDRAAAIEAHDKEQRQVFVVRRRNLATGAGQQLREGDLLLAAGGLPVTRYSELEELAWKMTFPATVLRDGKELNLELQVGLLV